VQKAGKSGHFVRTISLRCYKTSMQLFMLLYSGRNAVVHPCKTFLMHPLWSVGEGTNLKLRFFLKNLMCGFRSFHRAGVTNSTDVNDIWQDEWNWRSPIHKLTKLGVVTLIFGDIRPPTISWEVTKTCPADDALASSEWICVSNYDY